MLYFHTSHLKLFGNTLVIWFIRKKMGRKVMSSHAAIETVVPFLVSK